MFRDSGTGILHLSFQSDAVNEVSSIQLTSSGDLYEKG